MKRGTSNHPKVFVLAELLRVRRPAALGYLQLLWDFTAEYAPAGDVGKYSDKRIAAALDWTGNPSRLVGALLEAGWLDHHSESRLTVHHWLDHCEKSTHRRLQRASERNHDVTPKVTPQSGVTDANIETPLRAGAPPAFAFNHSHSQNLASDVTDSALGPIPSQKKQTAFDELAARLYKLHPKKSWRMPFEQALGKVLAESPDPESLAKKIERSYRAWLPTWQRDGGKYAPRLDRWILDGGYLDDLPAAEELDDGYAAGNDAWEEEKRQEKLATEKLQKEVGLDEDIPHQRAS